MLNPVLPPLANQKPGVDCYGVEHPVGDRVRGPGRACTTGSRTHEKTQDVVCVLWYVRLAIDVS